MKTYAGFWQRVKAFVFDYFIILGYLAVITLLFFVINRLTGRLQELFASRVQSQVIIILILTLPVALYFAISEASIRQGTWGKQRLGLKVTDRDGNRISFWRSLIRSFVKFIPWEISHTLLWDISFRQGLFPTYVSHGYTLVYLLIGLNIVSVFMTSTKQSLYDLLAGTYVVNNDL